MLVIVSYLEELREGFRNHDWKTFEILNLAFGIDLHYHVTRREADTKWYWNKTGKGGQGNNRIITKLKDLPRYLHGGVNYVNVQPPQIFRRFEKTGQNLTFFNHPDEPVCYVFGPNHGEIELLPGYNVYITLKQSTLYASSAAGIVLYDRDAKFATGTRSRPAAEWDEPYG